MTPDEERAIRMVASAVWRSLSWRDRASASLAAFAWALVVAAALLR